MDFNTGDRVMHTTHGLGRVLGIEERTLNDNTAVYYMIQVADLTIWVPADENLKNRLRLPTSEVGLRKSLSILSSPAEKLPDDRRQRNLQLQEMLKDGRFESLCKVIRDLTAYRKTHAWNDYDSALMKRSISKLVGEWSVSLSVAPIDAERELHQLLAHME